MISLLRSAVDTFARQDRADTNYGLATFLTVRATGTSVERQIFIFFARPFPVGATIASAYLRLYTRSGWSTGGPHTITVRRVSTRWDESGAGGVTWNNRPSVAGATVTLDVGSPANDTLIEINVTTLIAEAATGSAFFGLRLTVDTDTTKRLHSSEAAEGSFQPQLEVTWSTTPGKPTDQKPSGGRIVSLAQNTYQWAFNDADGDDQSAYQVQIDDDSAFGSPLRDTGWVTSADQEYVLETASLVDGTTYFWRVRAKDTAGVASDWSDAQQFKRDTKGSLSITSPSGATVDDVTPAIVHSFTGETQEAVRYILEYKPTGYTYFLEKYDSGLIKTTATTFTLPEDLIINETTTYRIRVRVYDTKDREATPGDPRHVEATKEFTYVRSGTPAAVESLTVTTDDSPAYTLDWSRTNTPDFFAIKVDGEFPEGMARIDPEDVRITSTTYRMKVWELNPATSHTFEVEAVTSGSGHSDGNPTVAKTINPRNAWLIVPARDVYVPVLTPGPASSYELGENAEMFFPIGRQDPVRISDVVRGYEGRIEGSLAHNMLGLTGKQWRAKLEDVKRWARRGERIVLVHGDRQFRIVLGAVTCVPLPGTDPANKWFDVTFEFWQANNFPVPK